MIEFFSDENVLRPQLAFLLFLQMLREHYFPNLTDFFLTVTLLGEFVIPTVICSIVYWCIDTKSGVYLFSLASTNVIISQFFKMLACVYRPWVLSDKIRPVHAALKAAGGYSFPSGHSAGASAIFGGLALLFKNKIFLSAVCIFIALTVGFSRMWLGVHTPQDVIVGLTIGFTLVFAVKYIIDKAEKNKKNYLYYILITDITVALMIIYSCCFNDFPKDFVDGKLLVNPENSIDNYLYCNFYALGLINGLFLCRGLFPFEAKNASLKTKILRGIIGLIAVYLLFNYFVPVLNSDICHKLLRYTGLFLTGFFITAIYPFVFSKIEKN